MRLPILAAFAASALSYGSLEIRSRQGSDDLTRSLQPRSSSGSLFASSSGSSLVGSSPRSSSPHRSESVSDSVTSESLGSKSSHWSDTSDSSGGEIGTTHRSAVVGTTQIDVRGKTTITYKQKGQPPVVQDTHGKCQSVSFSARGRSRVKVKTKEDSFARVYQSGGKTRQKIDGFGHIGSVEGVDKVDGGALTRDSADHRAAVVDVKGKGTIRGRLTPQRLH